MGEWISRRSIIMKLAIILVLLGVAAWAEATYGSHISVLDDESKRDLDNFEGAFDDEVKKRDLDDDDEEPDEDDLDRRFVAKRSEENPRRARSAQRARSSHYRYKCNNA